LIDSADGPNVLGLLRGRFSSDDMDLPWKDGKKCVGGGGSVKFGAPTNSGSGGREYTGHGELSADMDVGIGVPSDMVGGIGVPSADVVG